MVALDIGFEFTTKRQTFFDALLCRPIRLSASEYVTAKKQMKFIFAIKQQYLIKKIGSVGLCFFV